MEVWSSISPRLAWGITIFVVGLIALGGATLVALVWMQRRAAEQHEDQIVRLLRNTTVPLAIQIANRGIDLVFALVLYRLIPPLKIADYEFAAFLTTLLLATIAEWGLNLYLTREVARDRSAIERMFGTTLIVRLAFGALVIPISLLVALSYNLLYQRGLISAGFDQEATLLLVILGGTVLLDSFKGAVTALFMAVERPIVPAVVNLLTNILSALFKVAALLLGFGILGVAWAALIVTLISVALFARLQQRTWGWLPLRFDTQLSRGLLAAGLPLMLNSLLLAVFFRFDVTIIRAFDYDRLADYGAAYKFVGLTQILPPIVIGAVFPLFARQAATDRDGLRRAYSYLIRLLVLIALPLATMLSVLAPWWIGWLAGSQYIPFGAPALAILIWYLPLSYINGVTQYVLIALDRPKTITFAFAAAAVFNLCFNLFFVPRYGINAAALATVLSEVVLFVPLWRVLRSQLSPAPIWQLAWRPSLAAAAMGVVMLLASRAHSLLSIGAGAAVFAGLLVVLGAIHEDDRRLARRVLKRA